MENAFSLSASNTDFQYIYAMLGRWSKEDYKGKDSGINLLACFVIPFTYQYWLLKLHTGRIMMISPKALEPQLQV